VSEYSFAPVDICVLQMGYQRLTGSTAPAHPTRHELFPRIARQFSANQDRFKGNNFYIDFAIKWYLSHPDYYQPVGMGNAMAPGNVHADLYINGMNVLTVPSVLATPSWGQDYEWLAGFDRYWLYSWNPTIEFYFRSGGVGMYLHCSLQIRYVTESVIKARYGSIKNAK
jgi:hypothetical protein